MYPKDFRYSSQHEWICNEEGDTYAIGVTHFAQDELGEVVFVETPSIGDEFSADEEMGTIESVKAVAEVYTPVAGRVVEVNEALADHPELVNEDPHGEGWLVKLQIAAADVLDSLMTAEQYEELIEKGG